MPSTRSGRTILVATVVVLAIDVVGGILAVSSGVNTWAEAWGSRALLAAPWPMMAAQLLLAWIAARNLRPPVGLVAAMVLALACLVSAVSGFFDDGLANEELSGDLIAWQVFLLTATAVVGFLALVRARDLRRAR